MEIKDVYKLADLARIDVTEAEAVSLTSDLNNILDYIKTIESASVPEVDKNFILKNSVRDDEVVFVDEYTKEMIKKNFPSRKEDYLEVNKIINND
jgi:aspartyl/glutamyl-tRNA(Asn/Gln) amidotransferase C subunit